MYDSSIPMRVFIPLTAALVLWSSLSGSMQSADWHQWRGANRDGKSTETGLLKQWPTAGPPQLWRSKEAGGGYSSFSSSGDRLYTLGTRGNSEYVIALDAATGKKVWETQNGVLFSNDRG